MLKNSTGKEILATFWLDESHGYAKARFNLVSNSEEAIKRALDSLHVEKAELQPVRKPSRDL